MAKTQITTAAEAASLVKDGMTVMVGGFMANGTPEPIIDELVKSNVKDLTIICNDAGFGRKKDKETGEWKGKARGVGKLVENGQVKKLIASHVGLNPEFGEIFEGEIDLELVPQGTLAERIRCGGSGLGGFYTPTGVGTEVAEGKEIKTIDGVDYILELPLHADIALIGGHEGRCIRQLTLYRLRTQLQSDDGNGSGYGCGWCIRNCGSGSDWCGLC